MRGLPFWRQVAFAALTLLFALLAALVTGPSGALAQDSSVAVNSAQGQLSSSPPAAPSNLKVVPYGALDFYVTWTSNSTSQTGFQVYNGVTTQNVTSTPPYQYLWAVAQPSQYMCFAVRAYNSSGYSPWAGMWTCATTPLGGQQPMAPTNVVATSYSTSAIKISFTNQANNETAFLFNNGVTTQTYNSYSEPSQGSRFSYLWTGLQPHTWMCFQVASYNQWGRSAYVPSGWACAWTQSGGSWGNALEIPGSGTLNAGGDASAISVSCASAGNCSAGGYYDDASGRRQAFVASQVNGTWGSALQVPGAANLNAGGKARINSVSCASPGNCSAGGYYNDFVDGTDHAQAFVVNQVNGNWGTATEVPGTAALNGGISAEVTSMSCPSAGNCSAGGYYTDGSGAANQHAFVVSEVNGTWGTATEVPGMASIMPGGAAQVLSVSCTTAGNCSAGGFYTDESWRRQPFVVSQVSGTWGTPQKITGSGTFNADGYAGVTSVSCPSAGNCSAGGYYVDGSGGQAFVASQVNGTWGTAIEVPGTSSFNVTGDAQITSVSCSSAGNCSAGGYYEDASYHHQAFVVSQVNGTWGNALEVPGTANLNADGEAQINSVSCASSGNCSAGGYYLDGSNNPQAFIVTQLSGTWNTAIQAPGTSSLNAGGYAQILSVSCASAGNCSAAGQYRDGNSAWQALVASEQ